MPRSVSELARGSLTRGGSGGGTRNQRSGVPQGD
jgi:hypothetical protein